MGRRAVIKKEYVIALILLSVLVFSKVLLRPFGILDEIWNYNNSRVMTMGEVPYRDYNLLQTPLFFFLFSLPLHIQRSLFVYRLTSAVMLVAEAFVFYRVTSRRTGHLWGLIGAALLVAFMDIATYNSMFFVVVCITYSLLCVEGSKKRAVLLGMLCALSILFRQTSGVVLNAVVIIFIVKNVSLRKYIVQFTVGWAAILATFAAILIATGSFFAFWDYCFFALFTVGSSNARIMDTAFAMILITVAGVIIDIYMIRKKKDKTDIYHLVLGAVLFTVALPILDMMHMHYSGAWFIIPAIRLLHSFGEEQIKPTILKLIIGVISLTVLFLNVYGVIGYGMDNHYRELRYIPLDKSDLGLYENINNICDNYRAQGKRVVVLSTIAPIISIMNEDQNSPFDMFLEGNLGTEDPLAIVEELVHDENTVIVIYCNYQEENWQHPSGVLQVVQDNCDPVEVYGEFIWYVPRVSSSAEA